MYAIRIALLTYIEAYSYKPTAVPTVYSIVKSRAVSSVGDFSHVGHWAVSNGYTWSIQLALVCWY